MPNPPLGDDGRHPQLAQTSLVLHTQNPTISTLFLPPPQIHPQGERGLRGVLQRVTSAPEIPLALLYIPTYVFQSDS
jgi:hypothetical protein